MTSTRSPRSSTGTSSTAYRKCTSAVEIYRADAYLCSVNDGNVIPEAGPLPPTRRRGIDETIHKRVCALAARLFAGIRFFFVKYIKNKLNAFFLDPMCVSSLRHCTPLFTHC